MYSFLSSHKHSNQKVFEEWLINSFIQCYHMILRKSDASTSNLPQNWKSRSFCSWQNWRALILTKTLLICKSTVISQQYYIWCYKKRNQRTRFSVPQNHSENQTYTCWWYFQRRICNKVLCFIHRTWELTILVILHIIAELPLPWGSDARYFFSIAFYVSDFRPDIYLYHTANTEKW